MEKQQFLLPNNFRKLSTEERAHVADTLIRKAFQSSGREYPHNFERITEKLIPSTWHDESSDKMIESSIGSISLPLGIVSNVQIDGVFHQVPLATEEPSVVAGANYATKIFLNASKTKGIVNTHVAPPYQVAQITIGNVTIEGEKKFNDGLADINNMLMKHLESMQARGGGLRRVEYKRLAMGFFVVFITVDVRDVMGANVVNTAAEFIAPKIAELTGGILIAAIVSNYSDERIVKAEIELDISNIPCAGKDPKQVAQNIDYLCQWAELDIYRGTTHNKGIMNGVTGLALATGNDSRAIEAAAHTLALSIGSSRDASYQHKNIEPYQAPYHPLSKWEFMVQHNTLRGTIALPALFASKGGSTSQSIYAWSIALLSLNYNKDIGSHVLNKVAAGLGLAQNFAALLSISTTGIQQGHMKLHNKKYGNK